MVKYHAMAYLAQFPTSFRLALTFRALQNRNYNLNEKFSTKYCTELGK